ncbi:MAG: RNA polymerase sigma factor [Chloroflexota bacterium]
MPGGDAIVGATSDHGSPDRRENGTGLGHSDRVDSLSRHGLVAACLRGDQDAWEALVRLHANLVYAVIRRCGIGGDEASDLFQEVWVAAWDGLASLRDERVLAGWLATIAARHARRALRKRIQSIVEDGERFETEAMIAPDPDPTPDLQALDLEQSEAIRGAITGLSERDQKIVYAFFYDPSAPSYAQIAERLGVSPETVGPLRTRCLRRLRAALDRLPAFNDPL